MISFLSDNLVDISNITLTTGTVNAQYPIANIKRESTTYKFRSIGNTAVLVFDLLTVRTIDVVAIVGDAVDGLQITEASVKTSVTTDFSESTPVTIDLNNEHNIGFSLLEPRSHRFVELTLTGNGSFSELSNIFIGERLRLEYNGFAVGSFTYQNIDQSDSSSNKYGQKFINVGNVIKVMKGSLEYCNKAETELVDEMLLRHGEHLPLWVIIDPNNAAMNDGEYKLSTYCYLTEVSPWTSVNGGLFSTSFTMEQVI